MTLKATMKVSRRLFLFYPRDADGHHHIGLQGDQAESHNICQVLRLKFLTRLSTVKIRSEVAICTSCFLLFSTVWTMHLPMISYCIQPWECGR